MDVIRLIASDLDATLLDGQSQLPPDFAETVRALAERGIRFAAASGFRKIVGTPPIIAAFPSTPLGRVSSYCTSIPICLHSAITLTGNSHICSCSRIAHAASRDF